MLLVQFLLGGFNQAFLVGCDDREVKIDNEYQYLERGTRMGWRDSGSLFHAGNVKHLKRDIKG